MNNEDSIEYFKPHIKDYSEIMCVSLPDICRE